MRQIAYSVAVTFSLTVCFDFSASSLMAAETKTDLTTLLDEATSAAGNPAAFDEKMKALLEALPATPDGYYVVDGDVFMTEKEVRHMVRDRYKAQKGEPTWPESARQGELIVNTTADRRPTCWRTTGERTLTYAIDKASFATAPGSNAYNAIKSDIETATGAWESACADCKITFVLVDNPAPKQGDALFIVKYVADKYAATLPLIARAFFPGDGVSKRYLEIADLYYTTSYDRIGVLRHEVGHVLGYRHEQLRPEKPIQCQFDREPSNWTYIEDIDYDPKSVMHYPCRVRGDLVTGTYAFNLTDTDKAGHKKFYREVCVPN